MRRQTKRLAGMLVVAAIAACAATACGRSDTAQGDGSSPAAASDAAEVTNPRFQISLATDGPMRMDDAPLDVSVLEDGKAVDDVDVSVELRMPPSGAMGEMRTGTDLKPAGDGHYRGTVDMSMVGQWNAIVRVKRNGEVVATHTQPVTAR